MCGSFHHSVKKKTSLGEAVAPPLLPPPQMTRLRAARRVGHGGHTLLISSHSSFVGPCNLAVCLSGTRSPRSTKLVYIRQARLLPELATVLRRTKFCQNVRGETGGTDRPKPPRRKTMQPGLLSPSHPSVSRQN